MAVRFTRVFGLYTFFSVFLPGMMFLLGVAPLVLLLYSYLSVEMLFAGVPAKRLFVVLGVLVPITLGMFIGFGFHSLGAWVEKQVGDVRLLPSLPGIGDILAKRLEWLTIRVGQRHRKLFEEVLNGSHDVVHTGLVSSFLEIANEQFPYLDLDPAAPRRSSDGDERDEGSETNESPKTGNERLVTRIRKRLADLVSFVRATTGQRVRDSKRSRESQGVEANQAGETNRSSSGTEDGGDEPAIETDGDGGDPKRDDENTVADTETADGITESQANALYTLIRAEIHMDRRGRSRTYQAVFASCRSMFAAWALLTFAYTLPVGGVLLVTNEVTRKTLVQSDELTQLVYQRWEVSPEVVNLYWILVAIVVIGFVGMYAFASVARTSKRYYLEYLICDFLLLHDDEGEDGPEQETRSDRQQTGRASYTNW